MNFNNRRAPTKNWLRAFVLGHFIVTIAGCGEPPQDTPISLQQPDDNTTPTHLKIALTSDFAKFWEWPSKKIAAAGHGATEVVQDQDTIPRSVYLYPGFDDPVTEFPVGTIFVKVMGDSPDSVPPVGKIHAAVKRGGDFNSNGAVNWEWFELAIVDDNEVIIMWRGQEPPDEGGYGSLTNPDGETESDCNSCHGGADDHDIVLGEDLQALLKP